MVVAEGVEEADTPTAPGETETEARKENRELWSIKGESALELGAGKWAVSGFISHSSQFILYRSTLTNSN